MKQNTQEDGQEPIKELDLTGMPVEQKEELICPFCTEVGFDKMGLKYHIKFGFCGKYNETPTIDYP